MELKYEHKTPNVRTSLFVLSFVKTPLFDGETNQSRLLTPLLNVDTVGEAIVNTLYKGLSRTCYMPGVMKYMTWVVSTIFYSRVRAIIYHSPGTVF